MYDPKAPVTVDEGETVMARFQADRRTYIRSQITLAVLSSVAVTVVLFVMENPAPWVGLIAPALAIGARGFYLADDELSARWVLSEAALYGPGGRKILLSNIEKVRKIGSAVQVVTISGAKHLIKFVAEPDAVIARIETAKGAAG